ncbi:hypothetical protein ACFQZZ_23600 [Nocardia sp. GCM10030253]|uniref:hypothetical protein n=1 Tax=Nocardia sp. GCM10030253 TaxID=3273404 RepID=UPI00362E231C
MTTTAPAALNPSIIGQVEKHHTAILNRVLAGTALDEKRWITLNQAVVPGAPAERADYVAHIAGMTQWDPAAVEAALVALAGAGLVSELPDDRIEVTEAGRVLVAKVRAESGAIVSRAYGVVPAEELALAARVLTTITARLSEELAHA